MSFSPVNDKNIHKTNPTLWVGKSEKPNYYTWEDPDNYNK